MCQVTMKNKPYFPSNAVFEMKVTVYSLPPVTAVSLIFALFTNKSHVFFRK